jgi:hypothetical protein
MPELLVVHEFARRASTYAIPGPCTIIFNTTDLQKKKNTEGRDQGYLLYGSLEERYLRKVLSYLINSFNISIGMFLPGNPSFQQRKQMKFMLPSFHWNHAVTNFFLHSPSFTSAFYLLSTVRWYLAVWQSSNKSKPRPTHFNLRLPSKLYPGNAQSSSLDQTLHLLCC